MISIRFTSNVILPYEELKNGKLFLACKHCMEVVDITFGFNCICLTYHDIKIDFLASITFCLAYDDIRIDFILSCLFLKESLVNRKDKQRKSLKKKVSFGLSTK
ncbi:hypothetical protein FCM35_KLT11397 [Carex littledalei]|uniref:Uncharacterized protein n=1 Tax=Carex littledalei TaxID=544730 RepID=A0A833QGG4_9POAL|nr:hypothetical protein FCM35_KLT11397 [Carex littledalei]